MIGRISALLVLGSSFVSSYAAAQRPPSEEEREKIRIRVGMSREQQAQLEVIYADARRQETESRTKMGELYKQLYSLYDSFDFDRGQASALRKEISKYYRRRLLIHADTQDKVRKVLTREQFERLTALAKEQHEKWRRDMEQRRGSGAPGKPFGPPPGVPNAGRS